MSQKATLIKLSLCPCGFPLLDESIQLGAEYMADAAIQLDCTMICGGCGRSLQLRCVWVENNNGRPGFLPLEAFQISDPLEALQMQALEKFMVGMRYGGNACGMSPRRVREITKIIFPNTGSIDWAEMVLDMDPHEALCCGRYLICVLANVKHGSRKDVLDNLFRLMEKCLNHRVNIQRN